MAFGRIWSREFVGGLSAGVSLFAFLCGSPADAAGPGFAWRHHPGGSVTATPVADEAGNLYVASAGGRLLSLTPEGDLRWTFETAESLFAGPVLDLEGRIHVADLDGNYYCITSDGNVVWHAHLAETGDRRVLASPAVDADGRSFVASWAGFLHAFDSDGAPLWQHPITGLPAVSPVLDPRGFLYVASWEPDEPWVLRIERLQPRWHQVLWRKQYPIWIDRNHLTSSPLVDPQHNRLYVTANAEREGILLGFELRTGLLELVVTLPKGVLGTGAVGPDGTVYLPCLDGKLYAVDSESGDIRWSFAAAAPYVTSSVTTTSEGDLLFADSDGVVYRLNREGELLWRRTVGTAIRGRPVPLPDGKTAVPAADGIFVFQPESERLLPQVAVGAQGPLGIATELEIVNLGPPTTVEIAFFSSRGEPWALSLNGGAPRHSWAVELPRGGVRRFRLRSASGALQVGYARVRAAETVAVSGRLEYQWNGEGVSETWLPSRTTTWEALTLGLEEGVARGGVALLNASSRRATVRVQALTPQGEQIAEVSRELDHGEQTAWFPAELFPNLPRPWSGVLHLTSDRAIAVTSLRLRYDARRPFPESVPVVNAFPVASKDPGEIWVTSDSRTRYFPQVAAGKVGDYRLAMELFALSPDSATPLTVRFFHADGTPLPAGEQATWIGARSSLRLPDPGDSTYVGYGELWAEALVQGLAVVMGKEGDRVLFETGVPDVEPVTIASVPVDWQPGWRRTALAIVNSSDAPVDPELRLYDADFEPIATVRLSEALGTGLAPGAQRAAFLDEIFAISWTEDSPPGLVILESTAPLAVVALTEADRPGLGYPGDIYRLSVRPVLPGAPAGALPAKARSRGSSAAQ
ncbi:MAG: hypothetical protein Kow00109_02910 [Acidobacteriota bacterium]